MYVYIICIYILYIYIYIYIYIYVFMKSLSIYIMYVIFIKSSLCGFVCIYYILKNQNSKISIRKKYLQLKKILKLFLYAKLCQGEN